MNIDADTLPGGVGLGRLLLLPFLLSRLHKSLMTALRRQDYTIVPCLVWARAQDHMLRAGV